MKMDFGIELNRGTARYLKGRHRALQFRDQVAARSSLFLRNEPTRRPILILRKTDSAKRTPHLKVLLCNALRLSRSRLRSIKREIGSAGASPSRQSFQGAFLWQRVAMAIALETSGEVGWGAVN